MYTSLEGDKGNTGFFHRYKKPLVFLASIIAIVGIILIIVFALLDHTGRPAGDIEKYPFTLDSIFNNSLNPSTFKLKWDANGESYIYQDSVTRNYYRRNVTSDTSSLAINVTHLAEQVPNYSGFTSSADGSLLLVSFNVTKVWRHSYTSSYRVVNLNTQAVHDLAGGVQLQNVAWNPANYHVAYVLNNDIYTVDASSSTASPVRVTTDGDAEEGILNGIQSWVYEEEIFSDFGALWWSPDGNSLAYLRFDESQVPIFYYTLYHDEAYTTQVPLRYPKAGYNNPEAQLKVFDVVNGSSNAFPTQSFGHNETWEYIASVQWSTNNQLWIQTLNRYQNITSIQALSHASGDWHSETVYTQSTSKWIEVYPITFFNDNGVLYNLTILPLNGNFHIASLEAIAAGSWKSPPDFLTNGNFDAISIAGYAAGKIFYHATPPVDPLNPIAATLQHIYTIDVVTNDILQVGAGTGVYSASSFSPAGNYFVVNYLGPNIPQTNLVSTDYKKNITLEDNKAYSEVIKHYDFPTKVYTTVKGEAGDVLNAYYKKPASGDDNLPMVIDVYAGPGTQRVQQVHKVGGLDAWLAANNYVVAAIDGRGTGRRGLDFLQKTYRQLGLLEIEDQRAGAKELAKMGLVNDKRVAIWGWSFGGFMAAHAIAGTQSIEGFNFKAAVSVAPVSDWRFYDSVYTERFMSTPADNPLGYNATSVLKHAANIPDNKFLLMHGTGDDNVHFQNTVELANVLIQSGVQFDTQFFPNDDHSINTGNSRRYLYEKLTNFLKDEL